MSRARRAARRIAAVLGRRQNDGVVAIEFAVLATLFLVILAGAVDIGMLLYTASQLDAAVDAGAQYTENNAALVSSNPTGLATSISTIVDGILGTGATTSVDVNNGTTSLYCPTGSPSNNWSWGSAQSSGTACSGGGIAGQFVKITTSRSVSPLFPTFGFVQNGTLSRSAVIETQ